MSERMTSIRLPYLRRGTGIADWGRKTPAEMIEIIRSHAAQARDEAKAILDAADADFRVETYTGIHVQRNREVLQEGADELITASQTTIGEALSLAQGERS